MHFSTQCLSYLAVEAKNQRDFIWSNETEKYVIYLFPLRPRKKEDQLLNNNKNDDEEKKMEINLHANIATCEFPKNHRRFESVQS